MNAIRQTQQEKYAAEPLLFHAAGAADAAGVSAAPGAVLALVRGAETTILAAGPPALVASHPAAATARRISLPHDVLIPGLVNTHAHLDLTHIGPVPFDPSRGFGAWAEIVIKGRACDDAALRASVREGIARSLRGGVVAIGDITGVGRLEPLEELRASPLIGVSYVECFGFGERADQSAAIARALVSGPHNTDAQNANVRLGISPHAPYSVGLSLYDALAALSAESGVPLCTHLAESPDEREFIAAATGQMRDLAERLGVWSDATARDVGKGKRPIDHLAGALARAPMLLAHVNDCPDEGLDTIAASRSSVVWCPRGHAYFGRPAQFGEHRWRDMLAAGINVCLGTDSIINLPADESDRLSPLDEARFLFHHGERDATLLLRLITTNAAAALGLDAAHFTFAPGPIAGIAAVRIEQSATDPAVALMTSRATPRLLTIGAALQPEALTP